MLQNRYAELSAAADRLHTVAIVQFVLGTRLPVSARVQKQSHMTGCKQRYDALWWLASVLQWA